MSNLALSIASQFPDAPIASQDYVNLVDRRTNAVILKWGGSDLLPDRLLAELDTDLNELSIRQFETKWEIGN